MLIRRIAFSIFTLFVASAAHALDTSEIETKLQSIKLPPGFKISLYADNLPNARSLALGEKGTVFVSTRNEKHVYAVVDKNGDGRADERHIIFTLGEPIDGKEQASPNGIAFREGALYIATISQIFRLDDIESKLANPPAPVLITNDYPADKVHGWKYIAFGRDGKLYVPVGTPCNICDPEDEIYGTITRINADGTGREIVAHGVRNTVGFDFHPVTGQLWFTENGADQLGNDIPGDELNVVTARGQHFGNPFFHEGDLPDKEFGQNKNPEDYVKPVVKLGAHVAALGMKFYTGAMFPEEYKHRIFIAEHGNGNKKPPVGFRVAVVDVTEGTVPRYEDFATGWVEGETAWGRPVDVLVMQDGSLLVSDDRAGAVYRITYGKK